VYRKKIKKVDEEVILILKSYLNILLKRLNIKGRLQFVLTQDNRFHPKKQAKIILN
jgi:hypothetical protein